MVFQQKKFNSSVRKFICGAIPECNHDYAFLKHGIIAPEELYHLIYDFCNKKGLAGKNWMQKSGQEGEIGKLE